MHPVRPQAPEGLADTLNTAAPRDRQQRIRDTLAKLTEPAADVWVATASGADGDPLPYLVPL